jgi:rod shape determining protein RodA
VISRSTKPSLLKRIDFTLLISIIALIGIGLLVLYSATHNAAVFIKFQKQVFWAIIGFLVLAIAVMATPRFYHYSSYLFYAVSVVLLILVLLVGKTVAGSAGWFGIGTFGVQPSEFAKLAVILALARFLSDSTTSLSSFPDLIKAIALVAVPWFLVFLQPDFGTGMIFWGIFMAMIFWAGAEMILLLTLVSPIIVAVLSILNIWVFLGATIVIVLTFYLLKRKIGIALMFLALNLSVGFTVQYLYEQLPEYQRERVAVFLDPARAPQTGGYNVLQSKVAIGSGGLAGKGYLEGSQTQLRFVPEQWTDFIFCVPAEEFGFIGASIVLLFYAIIMIRSIRLARQVQSRFTSLLIIGVGSMFALHVFVNIGMTLGLLPVVGIPLPLLSYGGSFYLVCIVSLGMIMHSYAHLHNET